MIYWQKRLIPAVSEQGSTNMRLFNYLKVNYDWFNSLSFFYYLFDIRNAIYIDNKLAVKQKCNDR